MAKRIVNMMDPELVAEAATAELENHESQTPEVNAASGVYVTTKQHFAALAVKGGEKAVDTFAMTLTKEKAMSEHVQKVVCGIINKTYSLITPVRRVTVSDLV